MVSTPLGFPRQVITTNSPGLASALINVCEAWGQLGPARASARETTLARSCSR